jgi:hypothetical protein
MTLHPGVPAAPTALMSSAGTVYAFLSTTHWMRVSAGIGTTEPIPLPSGRAGMDVKAVSVEPDGRNLVTFVDGGAW